MGIYKVQSNGKAPTGLSVGDQVVTGGGTYVVTGVNPDGSYASYLYNAGQTTLNYSGGYDSLSRKPAQNAAASAAPPVQTAAPAAGGSSTYADLQQQLARLQSQLEKALNTPYQPAVPQTPAPAPVASLSFAEALRLADETLAPQYQQSYQQAADSAAQRLDRAGLFDSVYGQALTAQSQNAISRDMNAAASALALQLMNASEDQAMEILQLAVKENQFAANYNAAQRKEALNALLKLMQA